MLEILTKSLRMFPKFPHSVGVYQPLPYAYLCSCFDRNPNMTVYNVLQLYCIVYVIMYYSIIQSYNFNKYIIMILSGGLRAKV